MHTPDQPDPWASLAESLGVGPGGAEPPPPAAQPPRPAARRPAERPKPKPQAGEATWDSLASDLGITPAADEPPRRPAAPPPRRTVEPPRPVEQIEEPRERRAEARYRDDRRQPPADGGERREISRDRGLEDRDDHGFDRDRRDTDRDGAAPAVTGRSGESGESDDDRGERRGRRRRGRRGGRGRRDREPGTQREDSARSSAPRPADGDARERRPVGDGDDDLAWEDRDQAARAADTGEEPAADRPAGHAGDQDDDRPRRRRRRGRRGGRGRARGQREGADAADSRPEGRGRDGDAPAASEDLADEPLPTSYGMRPASRPQEPKEREQARERSDDRGGDGERSGSGRGRRRRRRGGESRGARGDSGRGRRSQRGSEERGSSSRSSRVRRADFMPVSAGREEDDEGLEFLGLEDADGPPRRREPRTEDDVLAESGLDSVRDVPSWVEAIGIVIAGNLDARSRGRGEGGRRDR